MFQTIYCFFGNQYLIQEKVRRWKSSFLKKHKSELNIIDLHYETKDDISTIMNEIEALPFLSPYKLIFVYGLLDARGKSAEEEKESANMTDMFTQLTSVCERAPETSFVVFIAPKPNKRALVYKNMLPANIKEICITDRYMISGFDEGKKHISLIDFFMQKYEGKISKDVMEYLIFSLIPERGKPEDVNMFQIANELEKLISFKGGETITADDVDYLVTKAIGVKIYAFTESIGFGNIAKAIDIMEDLLRQGEDIYALWGSIIGHFRKLLMIKAMVQEQKTKIDMNAYLGKASFTLDKVISQTKKFSFADMQRIYQLLLAIDVRLKTGGIYMTTTDTSAFQMALERFIIRASSKEN